MPVIAVMNGSIAEKAGICPGDCICALNNTEVRTREALDKEIGEVPETEGISLTVLRGDRTLEIALR